MSRVSIHQLVGIKGNTVLVFYSQARCWQFRVISAEGDVLGERKIYYSAAAAERAGREWVMQGG